VNVAVEPRSRDLYDVVSLPMFRKSPGAAEEADVDTVEPMSNVRSLDSGPRTAVPSTPIAER
jgi:hypothetical protein